MRAALAAATVALLTGCSAPAAEAATSLDGTAWRLTEIQSMDDAQGTTAVPADQRYTVDFGVREGESGPASFQIDCNRGSSTWQMSADDSGTSGRLTFGPIAVTEMACPPGSLDQRVTRALTAVRSYLLQDGRLHLSLFADSGILTWEPTD
ncbi:META domain-containing protein [Mycolicibacterium poriferae]|uniref:META domain-containing protein n=1 Tax=Mycolicibacterium poriferae TaxID=39694 RepID=UPI00321A8CD0